jgi:hypothetical protein
MMLTTDDFVRNGLMNWGFESACTFLNLMNKGGGSWNGAEDYGLAVWKGVRNTVNVNGNGVTAVVSSITDKVSQLIRV